MKVVGEGEIGRGRTVARDRELGRDGKFAHVEEICRGRKVIRGGRGVVVGWDGRV